MNSDSVSTRRFGRPSRLIVLSFASFAASQTAILLSSLIRIPLIVDVVGADGYGLLVTIASTVPWALLPAAALRSSSRSNLGTISDETDRRTALAGSLALASRVSRWLILGGIPLALAIGVLITRADSHDVAAWQIIAATAVVPILAAVSLRGAVGIGTLEARDHTPRANLLAFASAVVGFVLVLASWLWFRSFAGMMVATLAASFVPYALTRRVTRDARGEVAAPTPMLLRQFRHYLHLTSSALVIYGLDLLIAAVIVGSAASAELGLTQRLAILITAVPAALGPLLGNKVSRRWEGGGEAAATRELRRYLLLVGGASAGAALVCAALTPLLADLLTHGEVNVGIALALAAACSTWMRSFIELTTVLLGRFHDLLGSSARLMVVAGAAHLVLGSALAWSLGAVGLPLSSTICLGIVVTILLIRVRTLAKAGSQG